MSSHETPADARELDVRDVEGEPFDHIMTALDELPADGTLVLVNSFEPAPLYGVLDRRGYVYETRRAGANEWRVTIRSA